MPVFLCVMRNLAAIAGRGMSFYNISDIMPALKPYERHTGMEDIRKTQLFENTPVPKAVMTLAVPTVVSSLVMVVYNLVDTYFVGLLNDPAATAAVTLAAPVLLAFNAVNNLFGVGTSTMMSRAMGRKDFDLMERACATGFYLALICGVIFSAAISIFKGPLLNLLGAQADTLSATGGYLFWTACLGAVPAIMNVVMSYFVRAEGAALHASIGVMSGCLLNIALDPVFILPSGLNMGAAGAGCATFISNCAACVYFLILIFAKRKKTHVCVNPKKFRPEKKIVFEICAVGIPASIQNLLNVTGMTVLNNFAASYGADAVAAIGISQKINMIPMYVALGLGQAVMPLLSYNFASGNIKRMKSAYTFTLVTSVSLLIAIAAVYYIFAGPITGLFIDDGAVISYAGAFLRGMCLAIPFMGIDFLAVGVFQACKMGKNALIFAILRKVVLEIPALIILNKLFSVYGLAYAQLCAELVLAAAAMIVIVRMFKKLSAEKSAA